MRDFIKKGTTAETRATLRKSSHENKHLRYFTVISYCLIKQCPQFRCNWTVRKLKKENTENLNFFVFGSHCRQNCKCQSMAHNCSAVRAARAARLVQPIKFSTVVCHSR